MSISFVNGIDQTSKNNTKINCDYVISLHFHSNWIGIWCDCDSTSIDFSLTINKQHTVETTTAPLKTFKFQSNESHATIQHTHIYKLTQTQRHTHSNTNEWMYIYIYLSMFCVVFIRCMWMPSLCHNMWAHTK